MFRSMASPYEPHTQYEEKKLMGLKYSLLLLVGVVWMFHGHWYQVGVMADDPALLVWIIRIFLPFKVVQVARNIIVRWEKHDEKTD